ncbi:MAG: outer membrane lipoprotein LolB [Burkholderiales bacterium]
MADPAQGDAGQPAPARHGPPSRALNAIVRLRGALALASLAALAALGGCATAPTAPPVDAKVEPAFSAQGRLSARKGSEAVAVHYDWTHASDADRFDVATPLGQTVARMERDAAGVRVERPGDPPVAYADWSALTASVLGVAIPVEGLASWLQGAPMPGGASDIERDGAGRTLVLRQQGWEIVYAYGDASARPSRLVMRYPGGEPLEVRIVVDAFAAKPAP